VTETQTVDLAAWLTTIWDEEERLAKAVEPLRDISTMAGPMQQKFTHSRLSYASEDAYPRSESDPAASRHFNRHDPASVLARIAADRKILQRIQRIIGIHADGNGSLGELSMVVEAKLMLHDLASPYKGREGWQEEWADD